MAGKLAMRVVVVVVVRIRIIAIYYVVLCKSLYQTAFEKAARIQSALQTSLPHHNGWTSLEGLLGKAFQKSAKVSLKSNFGGSKIEPWSLQNRAWKPPRH